MKTHTHSQTHHQHNYARTCAGVCVVGARTGACLLRVQVYIVMLFVRLRRESALYVFACVVFVHSYRHTPPEMISC